LQSTRKARRGGPSLMLDWGSSAFRDPLPGSGFVTCLRSPARPTAAARTSGCLPTTTCMRTLVRRRCHAERRSRRGRVRRRGRRAPARLGGARRRDEQRAEYTAVRNALRAAADAGATSAHVRMDSPVVFGHLSGASRARAEHLIQLKEEVEAQVARYRGRVTFARIPRQRNGVADELAKDGARA
jgi:ribonuclease HI